MQLAVFALDGTLIDASRDLNTAAVRLRGVMETGPALPGVAVELLGGGVSDPVRYSVADPEIDEETALRRMRLLWREYLRFCCRCRTGASGMLKTLCANGDITAVYSNRPAAEIDRMLTGVGLRSNVREILSGDTLLPVKPAPDALLALQAKYRCEAADCWLIAADELTLTTGRNAGYRTVRCPGTEGAPGAEFSLPDFTGLTALLHENRNR